MDSIDKAWADQIIDHSFVTFSPAAISLWLKERSRYSILRGQETHGELTIHVTKHADLSELDTIRPYGVFVDIKHDLRWWKPLRKRHQMILYGVRHG